MKSALFKSSLTRKFWMAATGLFLIAFLVIHCTINAMIFFNDGGITFNYWAHFMGHNLIIRTVEIGLFIGLLLHVVDGLLLYYQNRKARPVSYARENKGASSRWYSRSMALLGILILLFLIVHLAHFFVKSRRIVSGIEDYGLDAEGKENLFALMVDVFQNPLVVIVYVAGCIALAWHLVHGFRSAFQSLGIYHVRYNGLIHVTGIAFSIIVSLVFALMPVSMYLGWIS